MPRLAGKVALVTGGGSGIGRGVVDAFVAEGARVVVLELDQAKANALLADHDAVRVSVGDATELGANQAAVETAVGELGGLDVLVCCAGVWDGSVPLPELAPERLEEAFEELFALNVRSYLLAARAALEPLMAARGSIVFTLSNAAFHAGGGGPLYTASKFAVRGLVMELAHELAPLVAVNGVAPGGTLTPLRGLRALGQEAMSLEELPEVEELIRTVTPLGVAPVPADHAAAYVYLADRASAPAVTGSILRSDGGLDVRGLTSAGGLEDSSDSA